MFVPSTNSGPRWSRTSEEKTLEEVLDVLPDSKLVRRLERQIGRADMDGSIFRRAVKLDVDFHGKWFLS